MSALDRHIEKPDAGVISSDLFIYDASKPGTGGLVSIVIPRELQERAIVFVKTDDLQISFQMNRSANTANVVLTKTSDPPTTHQLLFRLTPEFQTEAKVSLTVLFSSWKIVTMIDGEPLKTIM
jgi:hypothetical protein